MNFQPSIKTVEDYINEFPIQKEEVEAVHGRPTFTKCHRVIEAVKTNLIAIDDVRSPVVGKLHLAMSTGHWETDGNDVDPSGDPGIASYDGLGTQVLRDNYILNHAIETAQWENDKNAGEAAKKFILSRFEPVYFQSLSDPLTKFKGVTIHIYNLLFIIVAAASLLTTLKRIIRQRSTRHFDYFYIIKDYLCHPSPYRSGICCSSTSAIVPTRLVDLLFPNVVNIVLI